MISRPRPTCPTSTSGTAATPTAARSRAASRSRSGSASSTACAATARRPRSYAAFGKFSDRVEAIGTTRNENAKFVSWRTVHDEFDVALGSLDARGTGLGGWELDVHHAYDARMRTLYRGDGQEVGAEPVLDTLARTHQAGDPRDADVAPDGSVWVANAATDQVLRFDQQGNGTGDGRLDRRRRLRGLPRRRRPTRPRPTTRSPRASRWPVRCRSRWRPTAASTSPTTWSTTASRPATSIASTRRAGSSTIAGCMCNDAGRRRVRAEGLDDAARPRRRA